MRDNAKLHLGDEKATVRRLNETRDWLKHEKPDMPLSRNLVSFDAGIFIMRTMDKWRPWSRRGMGAIWCGRFEWPWEWRKARLPAGL